TWASAAHDKSHSRDYQQPVRQPTNHIPDALGQPLRIGATVEPVENCPHKAPRRISHQANHDQHKQELAKWLVSYGCNGSVLVRTAPALAESYLQREHAHGDIDKPAHGIPESRKPLRPRSRKQRRPMRGLARLTLCLLNSHARVSHSFLLYAF